MSKILSIIPAGLREELILEVQAVLKERKTKKGENEDRQLILDMKLQSENVKRKHAIDSQNE